LLFEGVGHPREAEGVKQVERLLHQHGWSPAGEGGKEGGEADSESSSGSAVR
jgi:hypothetical protein